MEISKNLIKRTCFIKHVLGYSFYFNDNLNGISLGNFLSHRSYKYTKNVRENVIAKKLF